MTVPEKATQTGEIRARWAWVEPSVWTPRMLEALEKGVKGDKWFSLIDKVYRRENLMAASQNVVANRGSPGVDHVSVEQFHTRRELELGRLGEGLRQGTYKPSPILRKYIPKPGTTEMRPLGIPTVRDRVAQAALCQVMEPIFEKEFAEHSYGFRPGKGAKDALRTVDDRLRKGFLYVVDADLKSYFDTIPHHRLMERIEERVADGRVLQLVEAFLQQGVLHGEAMEEAKGVGTPQGGVISPLLANIYLNPLDHQMGRNPDRVMVRYADDLVILCKTGEDAEGALEELKRWTEQEGLILHPVKTQIVNMNKPGAGFDFLGYHFARTQRGKLTRWPRKKSLDKFKDRIRAITCRSNGQNLEVIIQRVNRVSQGWFEYFKQSHRTTFPRMDQWMRQRLRNILRKRSGRKGRARGKDHHRWTNAFFAEQGLFTMEAAHARIFQSA